VLRYGSRVQVTTLTAVVNLELDRFVLAGRFGPAVAGGFELGSRVAGLFRLVPSLVLVALFPMAVTESTRRDPEWLGQFYLFVTKWLGAGTIVMAGGFVAAADPAVRAWLGAEERYAVMAIVVLVPAYTVTMLAGAIGILVRLEGRPGLETTYAVISVVVNLAVTWPFLVLWGPVGVPLATAVGIVVGVAYFVLAYHRRVRQSLRPFLAVTVPPVLAACVGAAAGWSIQPLWATHELGRSGQAGVAVVSGLVAVVVASGALAVGGFWSAQDRDRLRAVWKAFGERRRLGDAS
jgi:O-antigen/teichoic acid export membrane protein